MTTKAQKKLSFASYEDLKNTASNIDKSVLRELKRMDTHKLTKHLLEVEREARMNLQEGDEEKAYIFYRRAMEIYRLINDSMDDVFKRSGEGRSFYKTAESMMLHLGMVTDSLEKRFKDRDNNVAATTSLTAHSDKTANENDATFKTYAKPAEIVRFVGKGMNALVMDYRDNQHEGIEYKNSQGSVKVIRIDPRDIVPGSLLQSIFKALDISVRPLLESISHFDVVALLGDVGDITKKKGTKTLILVEALTTYNFKHKLRRSPVIIEGGFLNWRNAYPYYVSETLDAPRFEKTFDEQFTIWMLEAKKANELRIHYPNLSLFDKDSGLSSENSCDRAEPSGNRSQEGRNFMQDSVKPSGKRMQEGRNFLRDSSVEPSGNRSREGRNFSQDSSVEPSGNRSREGRNFLQDSSVESSGRRSRGSRNAAYDNQPPPNGARSQPGTISSLIGTNNAKRPDVPIRPDKRVIADESKQVSKKTTQIPIVDRSKKPSDVVKPKSEQQPPRPSHSDEESRHAFINKENFAPTDVPGRSTSPFPQILGGAGFFNNSRRSPDGSLPGSDRRLRPRIPPHPPTRGEPPPMVPVAQPQQIPETGNYFESSYSMSMNKIGEMSERGKTFFGHTGLANMGNTCFMNATLQPLFHTPVFSQKFRNKQMALSVNERSRFGTKGIITGCFSALLDMMWSGDFRVIRPHFFLEMFARRVNSDLADGRQHDAQEFQIYLLDALHEDTNKVNARRPFEQNYNNSNLDASSYDFFTRSSQFSSSPVNDIFNLTTISVLQCKTCTATSVRFESINQLSVELPTTDNYLKVRDCLNTHFSKTALEEPWDCPHCTSKQPATRCTKIWTIPRILIIHLKRFSLRNRNFVKNEVEVSFDVNGLSLVPFLHSKSPLGHATYDLYAITNHRGRLNSGHYTSNVINLASAEQNWLNFDDHNCHPCSAPSSSSKQAFLLYYKLVD